MGISAIVVARNEEERIKECLEDLRPEVDEIVFVDQASTDRTLELARPFADIVIEDECRYLGERSYALAESHCTYEWILILDADEKLSPILKNNLRWIITKSADIFNIPYDCRVDGIVYEGAMGHPRLFKKGSVQFPGKLHGALEPKPGKVIDTSLKKSTILHWKSQDESDLDQQRYLELIEREGLANPWKIGESK